MHRTFWTLCAIFYLFAVIAHAQEEPPVGWFFTPSDSPQAGNELAATTGASVLAIIAGGWSMEPAEGQFDFTPIDRHIEYAEKHGLKLGMICEVNPLFAPKWLQEKCKAAGQASLETRGDVLVQPALASPIFLKAQDELIRRVVEYVQQRDTNHVIEYYYPGAEWWFWDPTRYNEWDYDTFLAWLKSRYGTLEKLNRTWQAEYTSFDQISPPSVGFDQFGKSDGLSPWSQLGRTQAWVCDQPIPIKPRTKYTLSAWVKVRDAQGKGAFLSLELLPESDTNSLRLMESSYGQRDTNDWHKITWSLITQDWSTRARLRLNLSGTGLVDYDNVVFCEDGTTENLAIKKPGRGRLRLADLLGRDRGHVHQRMLAPVQATRSHTQDGHLPDIRLRLARRVGLYPDQRHRSRTDGHPRKGHRPVRLADLLGRKRSLSRYRQSGPDA